MRGGAEREGGELRLGTWRPLLLLAALAGLWACDSGPAGPGSVGGVVESAQGPVRAAVVELSGENLYRVEAEAGTWLFQRSTPGEGVIRLVLVSEGDHSPSLRVHLQDLSGGLPGVVILDASGVDDQPLPSLQGSRVRFFR